MIEKRVGIGEVKVDQGEVVLSAYGVGSCVVIMLYEPGKKIGGLAHILLPIGNNESPKHPKGAIAEVIKQLGRYGFDKKKIVAKIVGGATMFEGFQKESVGKRNVAETKKELGKLGITIVAEDVLGNWGRSVFFNLANGEVLVKSYKYGERVL